MLDSIRHGFVTECRWVLRPATIRRQVAVGAVALAVVLEHKTAVPGFRLLLAGVVIYAPAFLFNRLWRGLAWLSAGSDLYALLACRHRRDWRGWRLLWLAFTVVWGLDLIATVRFFGVPTARELHPVTVALHQAAGIPGVAVAAAAYAGVVGAATAKLPTPLDFDFLALVTLWYGILVIHNYVLLLGGAT